MMLLTCAVFPQPNGCGLIEGMVIATNAAGTSTDFRSLTVAASLKGESTRLTVEIL